MRARAFAKINLTLRVLGVREDGYHSLRTVLQSLALHDTLTFQRMPGGFRMACDDPACPTDRTNLVWRAAEAVWKAAGRRGHPRDVMVRIAKRIPLQSGLGGGSSDGAAAIRGFSALWRVELPRERRHAIAADLGADVPFFLAGGTSLGLDRGDLLFPLVDQPDAWVTLAVPPFGVSTKEAYEWFDITRAAPFQRVISQRAFRPAVSGGPEVRAVGRAAIALATWPAAELRNDLEPTVVRHHPEVATLIGGFRKHGAFYAAMSGSGSALFGLFDSRGRAEAAARALGGTGTRTLVTRTLSRRRFEQLSRVDLPAK